MKIIDIFVNYAFENNFQTIDFVSHRNVYSFTSDKSLSQSFENVDYNEDKYNELEEEYENFLEELEVAKISKIRNEIEKITGALNFSNHYFIDTSIFADKTMHTIHNYTECELTEKQIEELVKIEGVTIEDALEIEN